MNQHFVGIHAFLVWCPLWATVLILYAITELVMHTGRDLFEGLGYQVAYSAKVGDAALFGVVFIVATILQRGNIVLPGWLMETHVHLLLVVGCCLLGYVVNRMTLESRLGQAMDTYHDLVIAPMILYFAITLLPVIWLGGTTTERAATICFVLIWVALVVYDIKSDRMNQRQWLQKHGVTLLR